MSARVAIWNPASGDAADEERLRDALGPETTVVETTADDPGTGQTEAAVRGGAQIVVVCGGDGTVRACLGPLAGTETALAVIPLGTGNLLASNLGLASGLDAAAAIGQGRTRRFDLGTINGETFAVMAGTGFDALMIRDANDTVKSRLGSIAYVVSGLKNLRMTLTPTRVSIDGEEWFSGRTSMVLVGNFGTITGGIDVFPEAQPDDGLLDVAVVAASTWREWMRFGWRLIRHKPVPLSLARRAQGHRIAIENGRAREYELDGESRAPATYLEIEIQPAALAVHQRGEDT